MKQPISKQDREKLRQDLFGGKDNKERLLKNWENEFDKIFNNLMLKKLTIEWYPDQKKTDTSLEVDTTEIKNLIRKLVGEKTK